MLSNNISNSIFFNYLMPFTEAAANGRPPSLFSCLLISNENTDETVSAMLCVMSSTNKRELTFLNHHLISFFLLNDILYSCHYDWI